MLSAKYTWYTEGKITFNAFFKELYYYNVGTLLLMIILPTNLVYKMPEITEKYH